MTARQMPELESRSQRVREALTDDFTALVRIAGLDRAKHFRFGDWSGLDARETNLRAYDFTGAMLRGADFTGSFIGPGPDDNGRQTEAACFDGAVIGHVVDGSVSVADLTAAADFQEYSAKWKRRTNDNFREAFEVGDIFRDAPFAPLLVIVPPGAVELAPYYASPFAAADSGHEISKQQRRRQLKGIGKQRPVRDVYKIAIAMSPTTIGQWKVFEAATGRPPMTSNDQSAEGERPITMVSWHDASAFTHWLTDCTGKQYRLLTEAEAEHCLVAGGERVDYTCDAPDEWFARPDDRKLVGQVANPWGVFDTKRYSLEWCSDAWSAAQGGPVAADEPLRVCRGADPMLFDRFRGAYRKPLDANDRSANVGFRVARVLT